MGGRKHTAEVGNFYYGPGHPMKPHRIRMTHNLLLAYKVYPKMEIYVRLCAPLAFVRALLFFVSVLGCLWVRWRGIPFPVAV